VWDVLIRTEFGAGVIDELHRENLVERRTAVNLERSERMDRQEVQRLPITDYDQVDNAQCKHGTLKTIGYLLENGLADGPSTTWVQSCSGS